MTQLSSNSHSGATPESIQHKDSWDELAELAAMAGYQPESPPGKTVKPPSDILLDEEDLEQEPADDKTKTPLWSNPLAKTALVSGLMAAALGSVGLFVSSLNGSWNQHQHDPKPLTPDAENSAQPDPDQTEISRLKTVTALGSQAQTLKQASSTPARILPAPTKPERIERPIATRRTAPVRSEAYAPPLPTYSPPLRTIAPAPVIRPAMSSPIAAVRPQPVDPQEAWNKALEAGSYGEMEGGDRPSDIPLAIEQPIQQVSDNKQSDDQQSRYEADAAALLSGVPRHVAAIAPGTTAAANLLTPIVWAQDLKPEQQPQRFGLQLSQPIYSTDGSEALPAGSQLIAKVDAVSDSGMMQLSVVAAVVPTSSGNQVVEIPPGAISIAGEDGQPLVAGNRNPQRDGITGRDITVALMGALGQVGGLLNRPSQQTTMTSPYLSTTSTSNGQTNILGGLLEGGFARLANQVSERQQRQIEDVMQRPSLWYIPANQHLQVFTTSTVELPL